MRVPAQGVRSVRPGLLLGESRLARAQASTFQTIVQDKDLPRTLTGIRKV